MISAVDDLLSLLGLQGTLSGASVALPVSTLQHKDHSQMLLKAPFLAPLNPNSISALKRKITACAFRSLKLVDAPSSFRCRALVPPGSNVSAGSPADQELLQRPGRNGCRSRLVSSSTQTARLPLAVGEKHAAGHRVCQNK